MTKEDYKNFENRTKCWICDTSFVKNDAKVTDHCHDTEKYRGSVQRDCNINFSLNFKIPKSIKLWAYEYSWL